jgi:protein arginine kinase
MVRKPNKFEKTIISTRMRLARNLESYPFPSRQTERQAEEVAAIVRNALSHLDEGWVQYDMRVIGKAKAMLLQEQHLISPALVKNPCGWAFISPDETVSVMVNEEDHLREQYIVKGFELVSAYERVCSLDDGIGGYVGFAYDKKLGYLTACPSNVGTGLRASVMMFLPALERKNAIGEFLKEWSDCALTVRGVFGEGTASEGHRYQISNDKTLGLTEMEILDYMQAAISQIAEAEEAEREKLVRENGLQLRDEALRAYGILTNCARLEYKEMRNLLTQVKLGLAFGFFRIRKNDPYVLDALIDELRPYSFCESHELFESSQEERDMRRAEVLRWMLPQLVARTD